MADTQHASPPGGTGPSAGVGAAFDVNLSTGTATHAYSLMLPAGVAGHGPKLALDYVHTGGPGPFGNGWRLATRAIDLALDHGTPTAGRVARFLDGGTEIAPAGDGTYRAVRETAFSRYTRHGDGWRVEERNGVVHDLGTGPEARVADPDHPDRAVSWLLETSTDVSGNQVSYRYLRDRGTVYLASVGWARYEVRFGYGQRPDVRHDGRAGFSRWLGLRCDQINLVLDPGPSEQPIRTWVLEYGHVGQVTALKAIRLTAHGHLGEPDVVRPTVSFDYTAFDPDAFTARIMAADGAPPPSLTDPDVALVTLDDGPLPGILAARNGRQYYWPNLGDGRFGRPRPVTRTPLVAGFQRAGLAFVDLDGSGTSDLMVAGGHGPAGYYRNLGRDGWDRFVPYPSSSAAPRWADPSMRLVDADADGLVDAMAGARGGTAVWRNQGSAGWSRPELALSPSLAGVDLAGADIQLADMTGDGLSDLVRVRSGRVEYWPSLGNGRFGARVAMSHSPRFDTASEPLLADLDGDGCADLVVVEAGHVSVFGNANGASFSAPTTHRVPTPTPGSVRVVAMSGRATTGLVWTTPTSRGSRYVTWSAGGPAPYLLTTVDNGAGLVTRLTYDDAVTDLTRDRAARETAWRTNFPFPYVVVRQLDETDQVTGRVTRITYRYHEAHFEATTRQFQGFRRTERLTVGDDSRPTVREEHTFRMAEERQPGRGPEYGLLNGLLQRVETYAEDGSPLADRPLRVETCVSDLTVLETLPDGRRRVFVHAVEQHREDTERTDDVRSEVSTYTYDDSGNVVREVKTCAGRRDGVDVTPIVTVREVAYAGGGPRYLVDKPYRIVTRDGTGALLTEQRQHYTEDGVTDLPPGEVGRGLVTRHEELVDEATAFASHYDGMDAVALGFHDATDADGTPSVFATPKQSRYDARGLCVETIDPLGVSSRTTYDAAGLFRTGLDDTYGHTTFVYDDITGQILTTTTADGAVTRFAYDAQGRVLRSALPGQDLDDPTTRYGYDETVVPHRRTADQRQSDGTLTRNVTYFDGSGQEIQHRVTLSPGVVLVSGATTPNPWGDPVSEGEPYYASDLEYGPAPAGPVRRFSYDAAGRVVRCENYDGTLSTAVFRPFSAMTRDAASYDPASGRRGVVHTEDFDASLRVVAVSEVAPTGVLERVTYTPGPTGEILEVSSGGTHLFGYLYDKRGSRLVVESPEAGRRRIWYDARKNPVRTVDGNGHDLAATWDEAGRLSALADGPDVLERYTYDSPDVHALGHLARVDYAGGSQSFAYSADGRLTAKTYAFDGGPKETLSYEYDPLGRQTAVVHGDGHRVEHELTANGWISAIPGILDEVVYDARGLPTRIAGANGVVTELAYAPGPGRISHRRIVSKSGTVIEDSSFDYAGELLVGETDTVARGTRTYTYDGLGQVTGFAHDGQTTTYGYSSRNLVRNGEASASLTYDPLRPQRPTRFAVDESAPLGLRHDAGGNLLTLPGMTLSYNAKNELVRLGKTDGTVASYTYDHLGLRASKTVERNGVGETTWYVGDQSEIRDGNRTLFVGFGGVRIAVVDPGGVRLLHPDASGTTLFVTDHSGETVGSVDRAPYGGERGSAGVVTSDTYGLHPVDPESGLVYMMRRYYSPLLGRFLTPDLMAVYQGEKYVHQPAGLHLYSYVANDPLNRTDPDGLSFWSVVGAVAGVVVGIVAGILVAAAVVATGGIAGVLIGIGLAFAASLVVTGVSYVIASNVDPNGGFGQFMRGFMIGFNAGLNGVLASAFFGPYVGVTLGVINFLAAFDTIAKNKVYQGILGWTSWIMPQSWGATGLGLVFYVVNLLGALFTAQQVDALKIDRLGVDWKTGTLVMSGGLIRNPTAFNMGHFVFMNPSYVNGSTPDRTYDAVLDHETGHTLTVAAFGSAFSLCDLIGENIVGSGVNDYGELLAESHANRSNRPTIPMWG